MAYWTAGVLALCALTLGCSTTVHKDADASGVSGAGNDSDASTDARAAGGSAGSSGDGAATEAPCDPAEHVASDAIFVSPAGADTNNGSAEFPVQTISVALTKAKASLATRIYLNTGDYTLPDTLTFTAAEAGIVIEGGWQKSGATWAPRCEPGRHTLTTISVASAIGVRVTDVSRAAGLRHLTLTTAAQGKSVSDQPGESTLGVWATGTGTVFNLYDVELFAGDAGAGGAITTTPAQSGTSTCDGHTGCCTTGTGCGDNASGPAAPAQLPAAGGAKTSGTFGPTGYAPGNGPDGGTGTQGIDGKSGGAGQNLGNMCQVGGSCGSCVNCSSGSGSCQGGSASTGTSPLVGETGRCGCAGLGGVGGLGGRGGGASVALLVGDGATVSVSFSALHSGKGGDGGVGGVGGPGGSGAAGQAGAQAGCRTGCYSTCFGTCGCQVYTTATGGSAGTRGGNGGQGADGGGGSGGPSYTVVTIGTGSFDDTGGNALTFATGGNGADGAVSGLSGATVSQ